MRKLTRKECKAEVEVLLARLDPDEENICFIDRHVHLPGFIYAAGEVPDFTAAGVHIVEGSLLVPEMVIEDADPDAEQFFFIDGDMRCKQLWTGSMWFVRGDLKTDLLYGYSASNKSLCAGSITTGALVECGHSFNATRELIGDVLCASNYVTSHAQEQHHEALPPADVFVPELLSEDGEEVDWDAWQEMARAGRPWRKRT